jgi:hypothetical protein
MADDLQRSSFYFQLNQAQKISDQTLLQECDQDPMVEEQRKSLELTKQLEYQRKMQEAQAHIAADVSLIQARAGAEAQKIMAAAMPQMPGGGAPPGGDPGAGAAGAPPGAPQSGPEGAMVDGQQMDPAMPEGSTVSPENAQQAPQEGIPVESQSPLTMGQKGGGANLLYLANRAATALKKLDSGKQMAELSRMKGTNPQLYMIVMQKMRSQTGSQANPLDPSQSPLPQQKPSRRQSPVS